jgi:tetratricopeptide (TPR) repeat protein
VIEGIFEKLDALYAAGKPDEIEQFLVATIKSFELNEETHKGEFISVLNELAGFYRGVSRYTEAAELFLRALQLLEVAGLATSPAFATVLMNLAGLYRLTGQLAETITLFLRAKELLENADNRDDYAYASVLNNLSLAYQGTGELDLAFRLASDALTLLRTGSGAVADAARDMTHEIATALNNLAAIDIQRGKYDEAEPLIAEALDLYNNMPEENVHHAAALSTWATVLFAKRDLDGARDAFTRSLALTYKFFGRNIEYAQVERNLSAVYETLGDMTNAKRHLASGYETIKGILGDAHERVSEYKISLLRLESKS